jgi:hypothetical protein
MQKDRNSCTDLAVSATSYTKSRITLQKKKCSKSPNTCLKNGSQGGENEKRKTENDLILH